MENKKKVAAAIAGVMNYITTEEEAICIESMAARAEAAPSVAPGVSAPVRLWGISGRQAQMQMRNMMQMRTFR
jgi:hypothetical protein